MCSVGEEEYSCVILYGSSFEILGNTLNFEVFAVNLEVVPINFFIEVSCVPR